MAGSPLTRGPPVCALQDTAARRLPGTPSRAKAPRIEGVPGMGRSANNAFRLDSPDKDKQRNGRAQVRVCAGWQACGVACARTVESCLGSL